MDTFHRRRATAAQVASRGGSSYKRDRFFRTAAIWTTLVGALAVAGCSSAPPLDTLTTGSISPRRAAAYQREPVPQGVAAEDWAAARLALAEALREDSKAPSVPWENYASATRGTVTPLASAASGRGACRDFLMSFVRAAGEEWLQGEACRNERGWWKVDEARLLARS
jgi:surface antigen